MSHLLLWGNAYAQIIRDGRGNVLSLYPLLPDKMTVDRTSTGELYYEYRKDATGTVILRRDEVLHIPGFGFDGNHGFPCPTGKPVPKPKREARYSISIPAR